MTQQLGVESCDGESALERPDGALGVGRRPTRPHGVEEALRVDVVPVHRLSIARQPDSGAFGERLLGYDPHEAIEQEVPVADLDIWVYRDSSTLGANVMDTKVDLSGFKVEALDGSIGHIDESTYGTDRSYLIVDTGPWIFGKKVMLPAGVVRGIDEEEQRVYVNRTKDEIKDAPEFDEAFSDDTYQSTLGSYYGPGGRGYRGWDDTF